MLETRWVQNLLFGFLIVVLVLLTWWGFSNGVRAAQSKRVVKDAKVMANAFEEFHKDQNRYPATTEFSNNSIMRQYLANFPAQTFVSKNCAQTFDYFNASPQTYELRFCLSKGVAGYQEGWNTLRP